MRNRWFFVVFGWYCGSCNQHEGSREVAEPTVARLEFGVGQHLCGPVEHDFGEAVACHQGPPKIEINRL